jgi:serine protease Do
MEVYDGRLHHFIIGLNNSFRYSSSMIHEMEGKSYENPLMRNTYRLSAAKPASQIANTNAMKTKNTVRHAIATKILAVLMLFVVSIPEALLGGSPSLAEDQLPGTRLAEELSQAFERVAETITPSVVTISTESSPKKNKAHKGDDPLRKFFGDDLFDKMAPTPQRGLGTGVIVDEQGHILTNNHVIGDSTEVSVRLSNERTVKAKVVGIDQRTDLAVIKIKVKEELPKPAKLGDSEKLKVGEWVVAAGASFGLDNTITAGIVSAKGRALSGGSQYEDFIQTDAAINPGNSGGPLVNLRGEVVGINTAIVSKSGGYMGIGFAIPVNMARQVLNSLITNGKVTRGWLGVGIQNLNEDLAKSFEYDATEGALVGHVDPKGPAKKAGIQQGDIIVQVGKDRIKNVNQLRNLVATIKPGSTTELTLIRAGKRESRTVTIGELPAQTSEVEPEEDGSVENLGLTVEEFDESSQRRPRSERTRGVVITQIDPQGVAAQAELLPGDIIVSINGREVNTLNDFRASTAKADLKKGIRFVVESQGMERFAIIRESAEEVE